MEAGIMFLSCPNSEAQLWLSLGKPEVTLEAIKSFLSGTKMNMLTKTDFLQCISLMHILTAEEAVRAVCCALPLNPARAIPSCTGLILITVKASCSSNLLLLTSNVKMNSLCNCDEQVLAETKLTYMGVNTEGTDSACICHLRP